MSECRDFGQRAARLMLSGAETMTPRISAALRGSVSQLHIAGLLALVAKFAFEIGVETRPLPPEYAVSLMSGASIEFDRAVAAAFNLEARSASTLYLDAADAIRAALSSADPDVHDGRRMVRALFTVAPVAHQDVPEMAVSLFDQFFQAMTNGAVESIGRAEFARPDVIEDLLS